MDGRFKIKEIIRMIRRRAAMIVTVVVVFSGVAALLAYFIPPTYVASAKILIESQQIPSQLATSTVTTPVNQRLEAIEHRLMTRANLLSLIDRLDLYAERADLSKTGKIALIRNGTEFERITIQGSRRREETIAAFTLSYSDTDAKRAARIANELVTMVLEQNLQARSSQASDTVDFFSEEVATLERDLARIEADLAGFRLENELAMPETLEYRRQELDRIREQRFERREQMFRLEEERNMLANALETGRFAEAVGDVLTQEEKDLNALRIELTRAQSIYADSHPQVRALKARISAMERTLTRVNSAGLPETENERLTRLEADIRRKLDNVEAEIAFLKDREESDDDRERQLISSIERTPQVAMELGALERRRDDLRFRHEQAVRKQSFAETGERLEVNRQAERFEVIEQAQVPSSPVAPNRPVIAIGGFAGGLGLSVSLAILLGMMNTSIRTVGDMERTLELRPLMTVPYIITQKERRRARREIYLLSTLILVIIPISLFAVDQYYMPLGLLIDNFAERTQLREVLTRIAAAFAG
ncbi:MAG: GumC family protein [Pikeienuella sp.]